MTNNTYKYLLSDLKSLKGVGTKTSNLLKKKKINIEYYDDMLIDGEVKKLNKSIKKVISLAKLKKKYNVIIMNSCHDHFKKISNKIFNKITYQNSVFFDLGNFFSNEQKNKINRKFLFI